MAQGTEDIQDTVRICARHGVPVIAFGTGTSLEGQVNAPAGGVCIDLRDMNKVLEVHAEDLDCVIQPGVDRKSTRLNSSHPSISYAVFCLKKKKYDILVRVYLRRRPLR